MVEEVFRKYVDTAGNLHWHGTETGEHIIRKQDQLSNGMDKPRITERDIKDIYDWLEQMAKDPIKAFSSHTGNETSILASMTKQLLDEQNEEIEKWIDAYAEY